MEAKDRTWGTLSASNAESCEGLFDGEADNCCLGDFWAVPLPIWVVGERGKGGGGGAAGGVGGGNPTNRLSNGTVGVICAGGTSCGCLGAKNFCFIRSKAIDGLIGSFFDDCGTISTTSSPLSSSLSSSDDEVEASRHADTAAAVATVAVRFNDVDDGGV